MAHNVSMSKALRNLLLTTSDLKTIVDGKFKLYIYGGTVPANADTVSTTGASPLICTVAVATAAVNLAATATDGVISKLGSETWSGVNGASDDATFFRFQLPSDAIDTVSDVATTPRIQGTIGVIDCDLNVGTVTLVSSATFTVPQFQITLPV